MQVNRAGPQSFFHPSPSPHRAQQNSPRISCCQAKPRPGALFTSYLFFTKTVQNSYKTLVWGWAMTLIQKIIPMQSHQFHNLQGNR